ncbi:hypothetical protein STEG23_027158, partial [Scotinomys teguina]
HPFSGFSIFQVLLCVTFHINVKFEQIVTLFKDRKDIDGSLDPVAMDTRCNQTFPHTGSHKIAAEQQVVSTSFMPVCFYECKRKIKAQASSASCTFSSSWDVILQTNSLDKSLSILLIFSKNQPFVSQAFRNMKFPLSSAFIVFHKFGAVHWAIFVNSFMITVIKKGTLVVIHGYEIRNKFPTLQGNVESEHEGLMTKPWVVFSHGTSHLSYCGPPRHMQLQDVYLLNEQVVLGSGEIVKNTGYSSRGAGFDYN